MQKATSMKTFHGSLTLKSPNLRDRDASFSSYLTIDDPISELSIFDSHKYFNQVTNHHIQKFTITSNTRVSPSGDVGADYSITRNYSDRSFGAVTATAPSEASRKSHTGLFSHPSGAKPASMSNPPRSIDLKKKIKASLSKTIWLFRRKCPCSDKKSVQVKEKKPETKTQVPPTPPQRPSHNRNARASLSLKRQDLESNPKTPIDKFATNLETAANKSETHTIPISPNNMVDQTPRNQDVFVTESQRFKKAENDHDPTILQSPRVMASVRPFTDGFTFPLLNPKLADEDPRRDALEVCGTPDIESNTVSLSQSPKSGIIDDDVASDASSDLFEIQSFRTQTTSTHPGINFDAKLLGTITNSRFLFGSEESMTRTTTEKYEPSEASVDRSVSTAEGSDRAGVGNLSVSASEFGDGGEAHQEIATTHFQRSPLAMSQTAHISLAFAT